MRVSQKKSSPTKNSPLLALPAGRFVDVDAIHDALSASGDRVRFVAWIRRPFATWIDNTRSLCLIADVEAENGCVWCPVARDEEGTLVFVPGAASPHIAADHLPLENIRNNEAVFGHTHLRKALCNKAFQGKKLPLDYEKKCADLAALEALRQGGDEDVILEDRIARAQKRVYNCLVKHIQQYQAQVFLTEVPEMFRKREYFGKHYAGGVRSASMCCKAAVPSASGECMTLTGTSGQVELCFTKAAENFRPAATWYERVKDVKRGEKGGDCFHFGNHLGCKSACYCPICSPKKQKVEKENNEFILYENLFSGWSNAFATITCPHVFGDPKKNIEIVKQLNRFLSGHYMIRKWSNKKNYSFQIKHFEVTFDNLFYPFSGKKGDEPTGIQAHYHCNVRCPHNVTKETLREFEKEVIRVMLNFYRRKYPELYKTRRKAIAKHGFKAQLYLEPETKEAKEAYFRQVNQIEDWLDLSHYKQEHIRLCGFLRDNSLSNENIERIKKEIEKCESVIEELLNKLHGFQIDIPEDMLRHTDGLVKLWGDRDDSHLAQQLAAVGAFGKYCSKEIKSSLASEISYSVHKKGREDRRVSFMEFQAQCALINDERVNDYYFAVRRALVNQRTTNRWRKWNILLKENKSLPLFMKARCLDVIDEKRDGVNYCDLFKKSDKLASITFDEASAENQARKCLPPVKINGNSYNIDVFGNGNGVWRQIINYGTQDFLDNLNRVYNLENKHSNGKSVDLIGLYEQYKKKVLKDVPTDPSFLPDQYLLSPCWMPLAPRPETRSAYTRAYLLGLYMPEIFKDLLKKTPLMSAMRKYVFGDVQYWDKSGVSCFIDAAWTKEVAKVCSDRALARERLERERNEAKYSEYKARVKVASWFSSMNGRGYYDPWENLCKVRTKIVILFWLLSCFPYFLPGVFKEMDIKEDSVVDRGVNSKRVYKKYKIMPPEFTKPYNEYNLKIIEEKYKDCIDIDKPYYVVDYYVFPDGVYGSREKWLVYDKRNPSGRAVSFAKKHEKYRAVFAGSYFDCLCVGNDNMKLDYLKVFMLYKINKITKKELQKRCKCIYERYCDPEDKVPSGLVGYDYKSVKIDVYKVSGSFWCFVHPEQGEKSFSEFMYRTKSEYRIVDGGSYGDCAKVMIGDLYAVLLLESLIRRTLGDEEEESRRLAAGLDRLAGFAA